jgi:hypothetical protein
MQDTAGWDVVTHEDEKVGHVAGTVGDNVIVEHGLLRKVQNPLPSRFTEVDEADQVVRTTVAKNVIEAAPRVDHGEVDEQAVAEHYGLAGGFAHPDTEGYGVTNADDPAFGAELEGRRLGVEPADEQRARIREGSTVDGESETGGRPIIGG